MTAGWGNAVAPDMIPALTLRQPWAWAVIEAGKNIENRCWSTKFRGQFLIHAAKGMTRDEYLESREWIEEVLGDDGPPTGSGVPAFEALARGGIVGVARLVDVLPPCSTASPGLFELPTCAHRWHMPEQYGFVLADVRPVPFTPWKGSLGFFGVPRSVAEPLLAVAS